MRLIASDIDGTILGHDGTITPRTIAAFHAAAAAGVETVFVTGRPPRWLEPIREQIGHTGTVICSNGAATYSLATESVLSAQVLSWDTVATVRERILRLAPTARFALETLTGLHLEDGFLSENSPMLHRQPPVVLTPELAEGGVVKLLAVVHTGTPDAFLRLVDPLVGELVALTHSAPTMALLEMGPRGVNKAVTLAAFAASRGIAADDVVAFGDMPNDVEMLRWAGAGYAMTGGHPEALAAARLQAPSFADDGVAQVIEAKLAARGMA